MSHEIIIEDVPEFVRRIGDHVIQGSNNTILIFGTDRPSDHSSGYGTVDAPGQGAGAGSMHAIVGRAGADPNLMSDRSYVYLSMKSDPDKNLTLDNVEGKLTGVSCAIMKSDALRLVFREDIKLSIDNGKNYIFIGKDRSVVRVGDTSITIDSDGTTNVISKKLMLNGDGCGAPWSDLLDKLMSFAERHDHATSVGPTGPALSGPSSAVVSELKTSLNSWSKEVIKKR